MPLQKYRSVAEMPALKVEREDDLAARIGSLWDRSFSLCPPSWPVGVKRFASLEEANEDRLRMTLMRMRRTRDAPK